MLDCAIEEMSDAKAGESGPVCVDENWCRRKQYEGTFCAECTQHSHCVFPKGYDAFFGSFAQQPHMVRRVQAQVDRVDTDRLGNAGAGTRKE